MKHISMAVIAALMLVIIGAACLFKMEASPPKEGEYTIYLLGAGTARINIDDIGCVVQLYEPTEINGVTYKKGTIILPGNGNIAERQHINRIYMKE